MVGMRVQSFRLHVQGPCQSRSVVEVSEVSEMARLCWRGLVGFGICNIHHSTPHQGSSILVDHLCTLQCQVGLVHLFGGSVCCGVLGVSSVEVLLQVKILVFFLQESWAII
jgi:hypothetical protein